MSDPRICVSNTWLEPLTPRAYLQLCNLPYILSPLPWAHVRTWIILFPSYHVPCGSFLESNFGNLSAFSNYFLNWFFLMLMDSFYLFFFIPGYLIYYVVFQVNRKGIQLYIYMYLGFPLGSVVKESPCNEGDLGSIPGLGRYAHRHMTSLFSILAWRISWTEEPSRLQSIGSQRVGHIWINWACTGTHTYIHSFTNSFYISVVTEFLAELPVVL